MSKPTPARVWLGRRLFSLSIILIPLFIASCRSSGSSQTDLPVPIQTTQPIPVIQQRIIATVPPAPTAECAPLLPGMSVVIKPLSHILAQVDLSGFPPRKDITLHFTTSDGMNIYGSGSGPVAVKPDGSYSSNEALPANADHPNRHFQVRIEYSGGMVCTEFDVP